MAEPTSLELHLLSGLCERWLQAWQALPKRLAEVKEFLKRPEWRATPRGSRIHTSISGYEKRARAGRFALADLRSMSEELARWIACEQQQANHRAAGSLYSALHGRLENLVSLLVNGPHDIAERARRCALAIGQQADAGRGGLRADLERLATAAEHADAAALAVILPGIRAATGDVPLPRLPASPSVRASLCRRWVVVGVEDDPVWQRAIERAVEITRRRLPDGFDAECEILSDRQSAEARLIHLAEVYREALQRESGSVSLTRPLAVVDLGIPATAAAAGDPSRDEGLRLLSLIRDPARNIPAVVLTTAPNCIGDHHTTFSLGVSEYLLKGTDSEGRLQDALLRTITSRPSRILEIREDAEGVFRLDGVDVPLEPVPFRTLAVLSDAAPSPLTCDEILDRLEERYGGYRGGVCVEEYASPVIFSIVANWAAAKEETVSEIAAVAWFKENRYGLWQKLVLRLQQAGIDVSRAAEVAAYLDREYGRAAEAGTDYDTRNLSKHVHEIRRAIKTAFNAVGRTVTPEEEVLVTDVEGGVLMYRVVASVLAGDAVKPARPFRVVVVENDVPGWQEPIRDLLASSGYEVRVACSEEDGIVAAREFSPDLMVLDMHLPKDAAAFREDPLSGDEMAGLAVLRAVQEFLPRVRAVALTTYAHRDDIRDAAAAHGLRVTDFVAKDATSDLTWETDLILKLHRTREELRRNAVLPLPDVPEVLMFPVIRLWRSRREERYVEVFGRPWHPSTNQNKLLWVLAVRDNEVVPTSEVMDEIWGDGDHENKLKKLVQQFRKAVAEEWFGLSEPAARKRVGEWVLANVDKMGWMLRGTVIFGD
jgi:CheY-like chemotaxis protein